MDGTNKNSGGRPRKPADLRFPRRKASMEKIEELLAKEGDGDDPDMGRDNELGNDGEESVKPNENGQIDTRPIVIDPAGVTPEQDPPPPSQTERESLLEDDPVNEPESYYCVACETPLIEREKHCKGCGTSLDWSGI